MLDRSSGSDGMNLPRYRLHMLKGKTKDRYVVTVSGNWRVTFRFKTGPRSTSITWTVIEEV